MNIRNFFIDGLLFIGLLLVSNPVSAHTFIDNFDDQTFTENNWRIIAPAWSFATIDDSRTPIDLGYRGEYTITPGVDANAVSLADNGIFFDYLNLSMSTELKIQRREIYDGGITPKDEGGTIGFIDDISDESIMASLFYSYTDGWIHAAGIGTRDGDQIENHISGIEYDRFYHLDLVVDENGVIRSNLLDDTGALISTIVEPNAMILSSGVVGITSDADTIFNNYSAASPIPVPPSLLLFGTGLIGFLGIRKQLFLKK